MANYSKYVVTKPDICFINSSGENAPDVLVSTLHDCYHHQNECVNYRMLLSAKMSVKCPKYKYKYVYVCVCVLASITTFLNSFDPRVT